MGWSLPSDASGTVLFESLNFTAREEAVYRINQASIRLAQSTSRAQSMGYASLFEPQLESAAEDLSNSEISYNSNEFEAAILRANSAESQAQSVLLQSWNSKVSEERVIRLIGIIVTAGLICGVTAMSSRGRRWLSIPSERRVTAILTVLSSVVYFAMFPLITILVGWQFSASYIAAYLYDFFYLCAATALFSFVAGFGILHLLSRARESSAQSWLEILQRFIVVLVSVYFLAISAFFMLNSFGLPWYAADVNLSLTYFFILLTGIFLVPVSGLSLLLLWRLERKKANEFPA
jgi:hypothetical protein